MFDDARDMPHGRCIRIIVGLYWVGINMDNNECSYVPPFPQCCIQSDLSLVIINACINSWWRWSITWLSLFHPPLLLRVDLQSLWKESAHQTCPGCSQWCQEGFTFPPTYGVGGHQEWQNVDLGESWASLATMGKAKEALVAHPLIYGCSQHFELIECHPTYTGGSVYLEKK